MRRVLLAWLLLTAFCCCAFAARAEDGAAPSDDLTETTKEQNGRLNPEVMARLSGYWEAEAGNDGLLGDEVAFLYPEWMTAPCGLLYAYGDPGQPARSGEWYVTDREEEDAYTLHWRFLPGEWKEDLLKFRRAEAGEWIDKDEPDGDWMLVGWMEGSCVFVPLAEEQYIAKAAVSAEWLTGCWEFIAGGESLGLAVEFCPDGTMRCLAADSKAWREGRWYVTDYDPAWGRYWQEDVPFEIHCAENGKNWVTDGLRFGVENGEGSLEQGREYFSLCFGWMGGAGYARVSPEKPEMPDP